MLLKNSISMNRLKKRLIYKHVNANIYNIPHTKPCEVTCPVPAATHDLWGTSETEVPMMIKQQSTLCYPFLKPHLRICLMHSSYQSFY